MVMLIDQLIKSLLRVEENLAWRKEQQADEERWKKDWETRSNTHQQAQRQDEGDQAEGNGSAGVFGMRRSTRT